MKHILHLDHNHEVLIGRLKRSNFRNSVNTTASFEELIPALREIDGVVLRSRLPINKEFLDACPKLKFIGRVGAGLENIDTAYAAEKGIACYNAAAGNKDAVAEHCLGMMLSLINHFKRADLEIKSGVWRREVNRGRELGSMTVGIIGYGVMGSTLSRKLSSLTSSILCNDILENKGDQFASQVSINEIQEKADIISLHLPQNETTKHIINDAFIDACAKNIYLINTARGSCVDTIALIKGLNSGKILGAGLDVLEFESSSFTEITDSKAQSILNQLTSFNNVILTPHVAGWTQESKIKLANLIADQIIDNHA